MTLGGHLRGLLNRGRIARLRLGGTVIGADCEFHAGVVSRPGVRDNRRGRIAVGRGCKIEDGVIFDGLGGTIDVGPATFIGPYSVIYGQGGVVIGDGCLIASHCRIVSANHVIPPLGTDMRFLPDEPRPIKIGRDVWLGAGVTVLGGVAIGDGCVVGAGAVVTRDLPAGAVAMGVPAVVKRMRLSPPSSPTQAER